VRYQKFVELRRLKVIAGYREISAAFRPTVDFPAVLVAAELALPGGSAVQCTKARRPFPRV